MFVEAFEKTASTAFSRRMSKMFFGTTPRNIAKTEYAVAKLQSGKKGRSAFILMKGSVPGGGKSISRRDPLGIRPHEGGSLKSGPEYAARILKYKKKTRSLTPNTAKGTIATRPEVRRNKIRDYTIVRRGVGDLKVGTAKEINVKRIAQQKAHRDTPEFKAKSKAYKSTPAFKAKQKDYQSTPEFKAKRKAYRTTPEFKAKAYHSTPEAKAKQKAYDATPERKAKRKAYNATPGAKAQQKANYLKNKKENKWVSL